MLGFIMLGKLREWEMRLEARTSYNISAALNAKMKGQYLSAVCYDGGFSERTLLRARAGTPISAQSVKAIAQALDCKPEELLERNGICWISAHNADLNNPAALNLHTSLSKFTDGVIAVAKLFSEELDQSDIELSIVINGTALKLELTQLVSGVKSYWNVRPGYPSERGIDYIESSESADFQIELVVEHLRRSVTDKIIINGVKQFSYTHKPGWFVMFHKFKPNEVESYAGEQHFVRAQDFQSALNDWLSRNKVSEAHDCEGGAFLATPDEQGRWNAIQFNRANFGPGGAVHDASLPSKFAEQIIKDIQSQAKTVTCISALDTDDHRCLEPCEQSVKMY